MITLDRKLEGKFKLWWLIWATSFNPNFTLNLQLHYTFILNLQFHQAVIPLHFHSRSLLPFYLVCTLES